MPRTHKRRVPSLIASALSLPIVLWRSINAWLESHASVLAAWASLCAIVGVPTAILGGALAYSQLKSSLLKPDIAFVLEVPERPQFKLVNLSTVVLREPKYQLAFFDLDDQGPDGARSLEIPVKILDSIAPRGGLGGWRILELSPRASAVPSGHIVFGWAYVQCLECKTPRHYWVLIKTGEAAWYSEIPADSYPSITKDLGRILHSGREYPSLIEELVPTARRVRADAASHRLERAAIPAPPGVRRRWTAPVRAEGSR